MAIKERIDVLLVNKGIFNSRERAQAAIMAGEIYVDNIKTDKCGEKVNIDSNVEFRGHEMKYVSRGGFKLEKAMTAFEIDLNGKSCIDIGSSTGGFTHCMLLNGAIRVFAIDVGYGQLAWSLRTDERVKSMERTNIRYVKPEDLGENPDFASIDVAFISLRLVIPVAKKLLSENGEIVALIKPQFEAGRDKVGKKGVVRESETHIEVIERIVKFAQSENLNIINLEHSPIKGPEGNIEYLIYLSKDINKASNYNDNLINKVVMDAHGSLN